MATVHDQFIQSATHFLDWNRQRIARCLHELTEEEVWQRPNANLSSIGNLLLHLDGNIRQWVISGIGKQDDTRHRSLEFSTQGGLTKERLLHRLTRTLAQTTAIVRAQTEEDLIPERPVQAYVHDGTYIVLHVVEHLSYHTGQIIWYTKLLRDKDLRLYGSEDLGKTN